MAPKTSSRQAWDISKSELLRSLGDADIDSISASRNPSLVKAYQLRRSKISELEGRIKGLLSEKNITAKTRTTIGRLTRELKAVVLTDPTEAFKFDINSKKSIKGIPDTKGWKYTIPDWYIAKGDMQAHHIAGLDKYYKGVIGKSDADLFFMHRDLAERNIFLANHPKNRLIVHRSLHQGSPRRGGATRDSVHGILDWSELDEDDFNKIMNSIDDPSIQGLSWDNIGTDVGSPKGKHSGLQRMVVPDPGEYGYTTDQIADLASNDIEIANRISKEVPLDQPLWSRDVKGSVSNEKILKQFVEEFDPIEWPEGTREILKAGDGEGVKKLTDQIKLARRHRFDRELAQAFGGASEIFQKGSKYAIQASKTPARFALPAAGIALSTLNVGVKAEEVKQNPTLINKARHKIAQSELALEGVEVATGTLASPFTTPLQLLLFTADAGLGYAQNPDEIPSMSSLGPIPGTRTYEKLFTKDSPAYIEAKKYTPLNLPDIKHIK